jgi:hypothetical protein
VRRSLEYIRKAFGNSLHTVGAGVSPEDRSFMQRLLGATPPWFISMLVHASLFVLLGLVAVQVHRDEPEEMAVAMAPDEPLDDETFAETLGNQLEEPTPGMTPEDPEAALDSTYSISELPEVDDPLSAPPKSIDMTGSGLYSDIEAPSIGNALEGRREGRKQALLDSYGGTKTTQESVELALAWLVRQQGRDGMWSLQGPYPQGSTSENKIAATSMALLAFLGDGHTHLSNGPFRQTIQRGLTALLKSQAPDGSFANGPMPPNQKMYSHAQATIVLCELYALSDDSQVREAAARAIQYCLAVQSPGGGWRYFPQQDGDVSVTGWFVMALQSARMAKLDVPKESLDRVSEFLDSAASHNGSRYAYLPGRLETPSMTAEALLCRQYLGWKHDDPRLVEGVEFIGNHPVEPREPNVYYWYYATQVMHHMGGKPWVEWNKVMRQAIPERQLRTGRQHGSWDPGEDQWGRLAGRLFQTCLSTYMLEVYYRHLPLYGKVSSSDDSADSSAAPPPS